MTAPPTIGLSVLLSLSLQAPVQASDAQGSANPACAEAESRVDPVPTVTFTDATIEAEPTHKQDRPALRLWIPSGGATKGGVALTDVTLADGVIEVDLLSTLASDAPEGSRGFAGIAFRAAPDLSSYEAFYVRPTNGRAREQIRRNHSTQYISYPDFPWRRLREEAPGQYESYADLQLGQWTHLRVEIAGDEALLFVNRADQPALVVRDLKLGSDRSGRVGLWIGSGTIAYFSNLTVSVCRNTFEGDRK